MPAVVLVGPTIALGASLSNVRAVNTGAVFRLITPDDWTPASVTFQLSMDGTNFYDVFDTDGNELVLPIRPKSIIPFGNYLLAIHSLKIRSGTQRAPVVQAAARVFSIVLDTSNQLQPVIQSDVPTRSSRMRR